MSNENKCECSKNWCCGACKVVLQGGDSGTEKESREGCPHGDERAPGVTTDCESIYSYSGEKGNFPSNGKDISLGADMSIPKLGPGGELVISAASISVNPEIN